MLLVMLAGHAAGHACHGAGHNGSYAA